MVDIITVSTNFLFLFICFFVLLRVSSRKAPIFSGILFTIFLVIRRLAYNLFLGMNGEITILPVILLFLISTLFSWLLKEFKQSFGWALIILLISWAVAPLK
ncbi:hypothetical protein [Orenia marismortui]|uniref:Uncharacterized protein n=1 Tax=Orenia marismortui TaxID=46469 RepID=A0A4R8GM04_9FIRM|nr:hypothetical protein [Orenia marismortui]TDX43023.1 hypothetical protein C7959_1692 [Orenia marismortui]